MAGIEANIIQEMVDQIEGFRKIIDKAGEEGRNKLKGIKLDEVLNEVPRTAGKVDPTNWSTLGENKQRELHDRLTLVRDALGAAAELDGPTDPKHIMYAEYASNTTIVIWTLLGFLLTAFLLGAVVSRWDASTGSDFIQKIKTAATALEKVTIAEKEVDKAKAIVTDVQAALAGAQDEKIRQEAQKTFEAKNREAIAKQSEIAPLQAKAEKEAVEAIKGFQKGGVTEGAILTMVILLGALVKFIGNRQLKRSWVPYYLAMPFTGAGLAPIIYMLLRVGLINPSGASTDGKAIASLNLIAIYAFAALTGMFSKAATDKLGEVFNTMFRTETRTKDALGAQKPPGGTTPATGKSP
jgi:post-segregation antitoxin (ccd killing protein)